jgi:hypothetical protein
MPSSGMLVIAVAPLVMTRKQMTIRNAYNAALSQKASGFIDNFLSLQKYVMFYTGGNSLFD